MRKILVALIFIATTALGGSIGGSGGNPAILMEEAQFIIIRDGAIRDEIVHVSSPNSESYLVPDKASIQSHSLSTHSISTGEEIIFAMDPAREIQTSVLTAFRRSLPLAMPGFLPVGGLKVEVKAKYEMVPVSSVDPMVLNPARN